MSNYTYAEMFGGGVHEVFTGWIQAVKDNGVSSFRVEFNLTLRISHYKTQQENTTLVF